MNDPAQKIQRFKTTLAIVLITSISACEAPGLRPIAPTSPVTAPPAKEETASPPKAAAASLPKIEAPETANKASTLTRAAWSDLPGWQQDNQAEALPALLASCKIVGKQAVWREPCDAAVTANKNDREAARLFFEKHFVPYRAASADGAVDGLITGYYEPILRGSRKPSARNAYPLYAVPDDLLTLELGDFAPELKTAAPRVRIDGKRVVPYPARAQIDGKPAPLRGKEIAWVDDPVDLFFLHVQGSGRITLDEGGVMRVGFAGHNGHPYRSIGRVLIERGDLTVGQASMQGIRAWANANPARLSELLNQNPRYVFFRELTGPATAPPGSMGVPLTPLRSIAVDARYVPMGVPVHIATTWPNSAKPLQRLMLAQDIGGAIRGAVRADFFWGAGEMAAREAGRMQQPLRMWVLLPNGMAPPVVAP
jgi:membrane-bound lytic murein transglycosylase A